MSNIPWQYAQSQGDPSWTIELERSGKVVFPQRRIRLLWKLAIFAILITQRAGVLITAWRREDVPGFYVTTSAILLLALLAVMGLLIWNFVTRRPLLTVDRTGVRMGRKHLAWSEIERIRHTDAPLSGFVQIYPKSGKRSRRIGIQPENVKDTEGLANWLRSILEQQRRYNLPADS
jgi:hypothetical protein